MAEKVLSIEIGPHLTKVVETERKLGKVIYDAFCFETPEGTIENGVVKNNPKFKLKLADSLKRRQIKSRKVVFVIQSSTIGTKEETLPKMKDNKVAEYIKTNASTFFPVNSDQYEITYRQNGKTENGQMRAQLFAVSKEIISSYVSLAEFCQLTLVDLELVENGIAEAVRSTYHDNMVVNIDVESQCSYLTIVKSGDIMLQRMIPYGIDNAVLEVQESGELGKDLSFDQVLEKMSDTSCFEKHVSDIDLKDGGVKSQATEEVRYALGNITRILDYYLSQHQDEKVDLVIVGGVATQCKGFPELLANEVNQEIVLTHNTMMADIDNKKNVANMGTYFSTLSSAGNADGKIFELISPKKAALSMDSIAKEDDDFSLAKRVFIICMSLSAALILIPVGLIIYKNIRISSLNDEIASYSEAKRVQQEFNQTKTKYEDVLNVDKLASVRNDSFVDLLMEMEANLPSEAVVTSLSADSSSVIVDFSCKSKEVVASTISTFRNFKTVSDVEVSDITSTVSDTGAIEYTFSIVSYYVNEDGSSSKAQDANASASSSN